MATKTWVGTDSGNEGDWGTAANWSPSGVPIAADDVIIANSSQDITGTLDQSAIALTSLTIDQSYTGLIGSSQSDFLEIGAVTAVIGQRRGTVGTYTGSKRLNIDFGTTTAAQVNVYGTATSAQDQNRQTLRIRAVNASTDINIYGGTLAISDDSSNSSTIGDVLIEAGSVNIGDSVTQTTLTQSGGTVNTQSSITTVTLKGGTLNQYDSTSASTITTLTVSNSGSLNHYASGTITTLNLNGGSVDLTKTQKSKTVTTITASPGASLITDTGTVTITNDIALASNEKVTIGFS
jgi:hypothetical protein